MIFPQNNDDITIKDVLFVILKRWKIITIITVCGVCISYLYFFHIKSPIYKSHTLIKPPIILGQQIIPSITLETLLKNPLNPYLVKIAKDLNMTEEEALSLRDAFEIKDKNGYLYLTTMASSPQKSTQLAEIIIQLILEYYNDISKKAIIISTNEVKNLKEQIATIDHELSQIDSKIEKIENSANNNTAYASALSAYLQYKEDTRKRRSELYDKLFAKEMAMAYNTKGAEVTAKPSVPIMPEESRKKNFLIASSASLITGVLLSIIIELLSKSEE